MISEFSKYFIHCITNVLYSIRVDERIDRRIVMCYADGEDVKGSKGSVLLKILTIVRDRHDEKVNSHRRPKYNETSDDQTHGFSHSDFSSFG